MTQAKRHGNPRKSKYAERVKCKLCGARLNPENLDSHMDRVHPGGAVSEELRQALLRRKSVERQAAVSKVVRTTVTVVTVVLLLVVVFYFAVLYQPAAEKPQEWSLKDTNEQTYDSDDYYPEGLTLVEFFHSRCSVCNREAPILNDISANYSEKLTGMFSIGGYRLGDPPYIDRMDDIRQFQQDHDSPWPHLYDPSGNLMRDYGFSSYPSIILVKDNEIVYSHSGFISYKQLSSQIERFL